VRFMLLICAEEALIESWTEEQGAAMTAKYGAWTQEMGQRGVLEGGLRLKPTSDATTVRVRDDQLVTSDGPFAQTKEQLIAFFTVNCEDLDEAIEVAAKIPAAGYGAVEVRPVQEM
jgi:hypothetical protein